MQKSYALWFLWRIEDSGTAAQRAIEHARAAGNRLVETDMRAHQLATLGLGPRPRSEGRAAAAGMLEEARAEGDRRLEQSALRGLAMGSAFSDEFDEARRLMGECRAIVAELGLTIEYWAATQNSARIEILAGDLDEAARQLREGCDHLLELGETAFLSTAAAVLAQVEFRRGNTSEAERWLEVAERTASADDRASQIAIEVARGLLLLANDDSDGERHLRTALQLADETDALLWRSELRLDVARSLSGQRRDDAVTLAREASALAQTKQIPVLIEEARGFLAELRESV